MATLQGDELFAYLDNLEKLLKKNNSKSEDFNEQMHKQMFEVISAEKTFLKMFYTEPTLSVDLNGFPSVESLTADLEKIAELYDKDESFGKIRQLFSKDIRQKEPGDMYKEVGENTWLDEYLNHDEEEFSSKISFGISGIEGETENSYFGLFYREELFIKGYDKYSLEFPFLIREGTVKYHIVWQNLLDETEIRYYVPDGLNHKEDKHRLPKKKFDDFIFDFKFIKSDYSYKEGIFRKFNENYPKDYSKFLESGTKSRVLLTKKILDVLSTSYGTVDIQEIKISDLEEVLSFSSLTFRNAKEIIPNEDELYSLDYETHLYNTKFQLSYSDNVIGTIEYFLPRIHFFRRIKTWPWQSLNGYEFLLDSIRINIDGSNILNSDQNRKLKDNLKILEKNWRKNNDYLKMAKTSA